MKKFHYQDEHSLQDTVPLVNLLVCPISFKG
jgi:hypothetical protein